MLGHFLRGSLGSGVAVGARTAGALVLNKLLAVYGGPGGLTLLAHFQNLMALFTTLPNDGVHVGVVKYLAPLRAGSGRYRAWLGAGLVLNLAALAVAALALLLVPQPLVAVFGMGLGWVAGLLMGLALLTGHALVVSVLLAAGRLRAYVGLTVLLSLLGPAVVAAVLVGGGSIPAALLAYLLAQGATLGPALLVAHRAGLLPPLRGRVSWAGLRALGRFLLMALSVLLFSKAVDFSLRQVLIRQFGLGPTDLWQAVAKLSDNYTMVFSALMSSVYYPRLAALSGRPAERRRLVRTVLALLAPGLAAGLGALWLLRGGLLTVLFDARFVEANFLLGPQLLSDWLKFLTWVLLFLLTAQARVGQYVAVQAVSAVVLALLLALLLPTYGLLGAPLAQAARYGLLLAWCLWFFRRELGK
ncbi:LPS biosynthesis protein [Hymenobacter glacieicola]|uniref:LPS biosynthesis protein n=1 Tax=Hymenobacter glacieicola TaxID=1562124 RepID=A0ABQ1WU12_9BACT|nr:LPS biosynthesis protein [Hymenobacter glacieicola]